MRFLCLHGMGTNSDIYEAQLGPIMAQLDPSHEFVFVDGTVPCGPADGVETVFPPPCYCYYDKPTTAKLKAACGLVLEGGALLASMILHHQAAHPYGPDLFRVAVFTCASLPFDPASADPARPDPYHAAVCPRTAAVHVEDWAPGRTVVDAKPINGFLSPLLDGEQPLDRFHPAREKGRIAIPTLHVLGSLDPFSPQSRLLAHLCADSVVVEHGMGHLLPRDAGFARKVAYPVDSCIHKALSRT
ncbi:hypothetical protein NLU13_6113 [Sarocladium strictum]|uniref:Serine hydrolase domain-containing protein n=1 Tax=Sarocladium strictum TaxID=5046 RepID=A0AA39GFW6_SARSR|nr:hypothetical protein NLU13_6113 [Sarocladium strictum]